MGISSAYDIFYGSGISTSNTLAEQMSRFNYVNKLTPIDLTAENRVAINGVNIVADTITGDKLNANLVTTSDIVINSGGKIRSGKTSATDTTKGFYLGNDSGVEKFSIGDNINSLTWNGTSLTLTGNIYKGDITNTISAGNTTNGIVIDGVNKKATIYDNTVARMIYGYLGANYYSDNGIGYGMVLKDKSNNDDVAFRLDDNGLYIDDKSLANFGTTSSIRTVRSGTVYQTTDVTNKTVYNYILLASWLDLPSGSIANIHTEFTGIFTRQFSPSDYSPLMNVNVNNLVEYSLDGINFVIYRCKINQTGGSHFPLTNTTYWENMGSKTAITYTMKGILSTTIAETTRYTYQLSDSPLSGGSTNWSSAVTYNVGNKIIYNHSLFTCVKQNLNKVPSAANSDYWEVSTYCKVYEDTSSNGEIYIAADQTSASFPYTYAYYEMITEPITKTINGTSHNLDIGLYLVLRSYGSMIATSDAYTVDSTNFTFYSKTTTGSDMREFSYNPENPNYDYTF